MEHEKLLILAVDDSPDILMAVETMLKDEYNVFKLPKPTELIKVLSKIKPDLFLLDYEMPVLTGFDLIPMIREIKEHSKTPIIFLTSAGTLDHVSAAMALGASDFIVKPFNMDTLRKKIIKHIVRNGRD